MKSSIRSFLRISAACVLAAGLPTLTGCGLAGPNASSSTQSTSSPVARPGAISGLAHGGQQAVTGAAVTLWAAGNTSYGTGATPVMTATTDGYGYFNLNVGNTGTTPACTTGQLLYITVTGGNPGGGVNSSSALMAALPSPCNTSTGYPGSVFVTVNEVTTVASVWALQQFMSITPGGSPAWQIGAPNTTQAQIGLTNAFGTVSQLLNSLANGTSGSTTNVTNTVTYPVTAYNPTQYNITYTSTITPDSSRVNMVADILSSCVNSTAAIPISGWSINAGNTQATFTTSLNPTLVIGSNLVLSGFSAGTFFNGQTVTVTSATTVSPYTFTVAFTGGTGGTSNAADPGTATVTTGGGGVSTICTNLFTDVSPAGAVLPTDTIQAAYDIATAPGGITEYARAGTSGTVAAGSPLTVPTNSCSGVGCEWALAMCTGFVSATPPFSTTACSQGASGTQSYPTDFAIGVRWSAADNQSTPLTYGIKNGNLAIDAKGNIWTEASGSTSSPQTGYPIMEWSPTGQILQVVGATYPGNASAIYTMPSSTISVYETTTGNVESSSPTSFTYGTAPTVSNLTVTALAQGPTNSLAVDTNNNLWFTDYPAATVGTGVAGFFPGVVFKTSPASVTSATTSTAGVTTPYIAGASTAAIAIDSGNNIWLSGAATSGSTGSSNLTLLLAGGGYNTLYENQYQALGTTSYYDQISIDGLTNNAYGFTVYSAAAAGVPITVSSLYTAENPASLTSLNISGSTYTSSPALIPHYGVLDANSNMWIAEYKYGSGQLAYLSTQKNNTSPAASNVKGSSALTTYVANTYTGGLQSPGALSIDGLGNVFVGNGVSATASGVSEFTSSGTPLSPTNASTGMPAFGFNIYATDAGRAMQIDPSGNMWLGTASNSYEVHMVGLAAPVVTPTAAAVTPGTVVVTAWSINAGNTVATFTAANSLSVGQLVLLSGFTTGSFFNGQIVTVASATSTSFTANFTGGTASASATESGIAAYSKLATRP